MRRYYVEYVSHEDYLQHSAKGSTWKNHKYVKKETVNGKTRYYYTKGGIGNKVKELGSRIKSNIVGRLEDLKVTLSKVANKTLDSLLDRIPEYESRTLITVKANEDVLISNLEKKEKQYLEKMGQLGAESRKHYDKAYDLEEKAKNSDSLAKQLAGGNFVGPMPKNSLSATGYHTMSKGLQTSAEQERAKAKELEEERRKQTEAFKRNSAQLKALKAKKK